MLKLIILLDHTAASSDILPSTGTSYQLVLEVPLVGYGILQSNDSVTVTIIAAALGTICAERYDQDPSFGISDGRNFVGFIAHDHDHWNSVPPCYCVEGQPTSNILYKRIFGSTNNRPLVQEAIPVK